MKRTKEETTRLREKAYKLADNNVPASKIAQLIGVSERMVYRYIDAERLKIAEDQVAIFNKALNLLDKETLSKVMVAIKKAR